MGWGKPKFLADEMLGRLAKWLRLLGYDTKYISRIPDSELLDLVETEERSILTRDTLLIRRKRCHNYIFIRSDHWREQLKQVYIEAGLNCDAVLTMCPVCNRPLRHADRLSVEARVPAYVYATQKRFSACEGCSRVFWAATHVSNIMDVLKELREEP
jgi:uncharacterized protein with PIN domain